MFKPGCVTRVACCQDDELTVIRRVDNNWAEGKLADRIGIFPISFVEVCLCCNYVKTLGGIRVSSDLIEFIK